MGGGGCVCYCGGRGLHLWGVVNHESKEADTRNIFLQLNVQKDLMGWSSDDGHVQNKHVHPHLVQVLTRIASGSNHQNLLVLCFRPISFSAELRGTRRTSDCLRSSEKLLLKLKKQRDALFWKAERHFILKGSDSHRRTLSLQSRTAEEKKLSHVWYKSFSLQVLLTLCSEPQEPTQNVWPK